VAGAPEREAGRLSAASPARRAAAGLIDLNEQVVEPAGLGFGLAGQRATARRLCVRATRKR
jgi:hypothetical protein